MLRCRHRGEEAAARSGAQERAWWSEPGRTGRHLRGSVVAIGVLGALLGGERCLAQDSAGSGAQGWEDYLQREWRQDEQTQKWRLSVRPHAMATGTRTERAGLQTVDGKPLAAPPQGFTAKAWVYVPQQCAGTQRCPLL